MNIFDLIKPFLKQSDLTDEEIKQLEKEVSKPRNFEDLPEELKNLERIKIAQKSWLNRVEKIEEKIKNNDFLGLDLEPMPRVDCIEINSYYFYLISIYQNLYKYRSNFEVLKLLKSALQKIIDNQEFLKENLIKTEIIRLKAYNYNKDFDDLKEKAEQEINKINFDSFKKQFETIDYLYKKH